jgi:ATP synthase subunit 6
MPWGITNLALLLLLGLFIMAGAFVAYTAQVTNAVSRVLHAIHQLVRDITKENLYIVKQQYFAAQFYLFCTIALANLSGLVPYSFTITSSFIVTFFLAATYFSGINLVAAWKNQWQTFNIFLPGGAPLAIVPFLIFIEGVSYIARVFSLSIRLFANMMSGHALLKILIGFAAALFATKSEFLGLVGLFPWVLVTTITYLELLIAFLQAYVFVILVTIYIGDVLNTHVTEEVHVSTSNVIPLVGFMLNWEFNPFVLVWLIRAVTYLLQLFHLFAYLLQ